MRIYRIAFALLISVSSSNTLFAQSNLRVLTLNVWFGNGEMDFYRLNRQIKKVKELNLDVVCLQEVFDNRVKHFYQRQMPEFLLHSSNRNTPFNWATRLASLGVSTRGQRELLYGDYFGVATLLNQTNGQSIPNSTHLTQYRHQVPGSWTAYLAEVLKPRSHLAVDYEFQGVPITIFNTHLSIGIDNKKRIHQVKELGLTALGGSITSPRNQNPVILCGDTNSDSKNDDMQWLRNSAKFTDTYLEAHPDLNQAPHNGDTWTFFNTHTHVSPLVEPDQRVDYIYFHGGSEFTFEVIQSEIVFAEAPFVSDHYGVYSELRLIPK